MNIILLTFGGGHKKYYDAVNRLCTQAKSFKYKNNPIFNNIIGYTDLDLVNKFPNFWKKHSTFILNNKRGFGYWIWKSFIILETLKNINNNDILVYLDCGCELNNEGVTKFLEYIEIVKEYNSLLFHLEDKHTELVWNKMDLIKFLNIDNKLFLNNPQAESGMQFYKKCDENLKLLEEYYNICCNYNLIDDSPSTCKNFNTFIEHRHDQSVLSLLFKKYGYYTIFDETWPPTMINKKLDYPIWAIRNYSFESKIKDFL